jgi:predicted metal-dependent peptidase
MDSEETKEKMAKKISDAMESARKMAGHIPAGLEDELGLLTAPTVRWTDRIRSRILKSRQGGSRNDWTRFRTRPLFCGLLIPRKKEHVCNAGVLLDTSGSMSKEDKTLAISQLQSLDERNEITIVCADAEVYWSDAVKIKKCNAENLSKIKTKGNGGTIWGDFFSDYEKHIGKCDFLIVLSDMYLCDNDVATMVDPCIPVYWICTSNNTSFVPPFGKLYNLHG